MLAIMKLVVAVNCHRSGSSGHLAEGMKGSNIKLKINWKP